jgi:hypothetical protein
VNIPYIPRIDPAVAAQSDVQDDPPVAAGFTVRDGLDWLGISLADYTTSVQILRGRHGNPIMSALLAARDAQGTDTTPAQVLARFGIDPDDPLAAVRAFDHHRAQYDA